MRSARRRLLPRCRSQPRGQHQCFADGRAKCDRRRPGLSLNTVVLPMRIFTPINSMKRSCERGFTLVEVLVALVVLSVGLLGMAKMVMVSSHSNDTPYLRTQPFPLRYQPLAPIRPNLPPPTPPAY